MKKTVLTLLVLLLPLVGGAGDHDTSFLLGQLNKTSSMFTTEVSGLSETQWRFKPEPGTWSISECAQHIVLTEAFLRGTVADKLLASPAATPENLAKAKGNDEKVMAIIVDRSFKAQAPEPVQPVDVKGSPADLESDFLSTRDKTVEMVQAKSAALRLHTSESPMGMELDAYQSPFLSSIVTVCVSWLSELKNFMWPDP